MMNCCGSGMNSGGGPQVFSGVTKPGIPRFSRSRATCAWFVMKALICICPPQRGQVKGSSSKTRLVRQAHHEKERRPGTRGFFLLLRRRCDDAERSRARLRQSSFGKALPSVTCAASPVGVVPVVTYRGFPRLSRRSPHHNHDFAGPQLGEGGYRGSAG
jgi:hypothetical protein